MIQQVDHTQRLSEDFWSPLMAAPWRYDLFQLLRRIDALAGERYPLGRAPLPHHEPLRIGQQPSLAFAPSTLACVKPRKDSPLHEVSIYSFGLFGPNGPLPLHLTEYARERSDHHQDRGFASFVDLFHHRLALLFYRAWADAQPTVSLDRQDLHHFEQYLASLTGMGQPAQLKAGALNAHARYALAGHLSRHGRNAQGMVRILRHYFRIPVQLVENEPHWQPVDRRERTRLVAGRKAPRLGQSTFLGIATRDAQHKFCIELGPLSLAAYRHFLPDQRGAQQLCAWVRQYLGIEFVWEVRLILAADAVHGVTLGGQTRVGFDSWLGLTDKARPRGDFIFNPEEQKTLVD